MPPQRLTALWRSTSRLALRPQRAMAWTKLPTIAAAESQPRLLGRTARGAALQVRGYADDRTPKTDGEGSPSAGESAEAPQSSAEQSRQALLDAAAAAMGFMPLEEPAEPEKTTETVTVETAETVVAETVTAETTETTAEVAATTEPVVTTETVTVTESVTAAEAASIPEAVETTPENREALRQLELLSQGLAPFDPELDGHKFGLTTATLRPAVAAAEAESTADDDTAIADQRLPRVGKLQDRYDPVIAQLTRLLMRDGKLAKAQRDMAMILNYLQTSPAPKLSPARPLLPGHPPAAQMPLDPVRYLTLAIDSVAPLIKIRSYAGQAGGGAALQVPVPLAARQRRRTVFMWLLDIVNKKPSRGSGRTMLAHRIGEEVVAIVEGRSSLWDKRQLLHKQGTSARANVTKVNL